AGIGHSPWSHWALRALLPSCYAIGLSAIWPNMHRQGQVADEIIQPRLRSGGSSRLGEGRSMKRYLNCLIVAAPLLASFGAQAADLAVKATPAPVAAAVYNWTGLYVGVNGGWGWGQQDPLNLISSRFDRDNFNINGGLFGGTFGAQIQQGAVVLG